MRKYLKTGLLILTLAFPVLIFLFLKVFTTNHYDLPYYVPMRDPVSNEVVMNGTDTAFYQLRDVNLMAISNEPVTSETLRGKMTVVSSIRLSNVDGYDKVINELVRINKLADSYPDLVIITLVAEGDHEVQTELKGKRLYPHSWKVIQLPDSSQNKFIEQVFHLNEKESGLQTISLNSRLSLIDASGFIRGYYNALDPEDIDRLMAEIKILDYGKNLKE